MLISIIIPAFNAAKTIQSTIQSSLQQCSKLFDIEIIIVNDGSTDDTIEILKNYQYKCHIIHKTNAGVSAARQIGFEHSHGDYVQYLDSDDLLMPGKIKTQVQALITHQADIAYGDYEKFTEKNGKMIIEERIKGKIEGEPAIEIFKSFWRPPAATLYSRNIVQKIYWSKTLPIIQDARYLLDAVFMGGKLVYTPGVQAKYHIRQKDSLSQRCNIAFVKDCFVNAAEVYLIWKKDLDSNFEKKDALIEVLRFCIHELSIIDQKFFKQAVDLLLKIAPGYVPQKSFSLKLTSQILGYRNAEKLAGLKRRLT